MVDTMQGQDPCLEFGYDIIERPDPANFERHCHNDYELLYVVRGEGKYIVEGAEYPLRPNTLILIRPLEFHYFRPDSNHVYERYVISFAKEALVDAAKELPLLDESREGYGVYLPSDVVTPNIGAALEQMRAMLDRCPQSLHSTVLRVELTRVMLLISELNYDIPVIREKSLVAQVIDYINWRINDELTLDFIATHFYVSKYYLCHAFREHTGVTVFQYISNKRVSMAEQLLAKGEKAADAAFHVGFRDYSSFYRAYCKRMGHPPTECRHHDNADNTDNSSDNTQERDRLGKEERQG